jgi:ATP-dependent protease HslVU (ClpYQ) peptidase subunit
MTTIIAIEHEAGVTIGFDSKVSFGSGSTQMEAEKVFVNNGVVFGVAGAVLDAQILRYADIPDPEQAGWDTDRWVTNTLIPAMTSALHDRNAPTYTSGKIKTDHNALVIVRGWVYEIWSDTSWTRRVDKVYAIGSGSHFARGALSAGGSARLALEVAAKHDKGTGNALTVTNAQELIEGAITA